MKKKLLYGLMGLVVALSLVGFVSCDDDDDDDDDSSVVATYSYEDEDDSYTETFYFYDDATFKLTMEDYTVATGSYTGDATTDGNVTLTVKKVAEFLVDEDSDSESLVSWSEDDYGSASVSITISNGTFTISEDYFDGYFYGETFTKQ